MHKLFYLFFLMVIACSAPKSNFLETINSLEHIDGNETYSNAPYMTPGNRLYTVGHQNGTFPEIGWHIDKEMGGIWNHPIKLMDGFEASLQIENESFELNKATRFAQYSFSNVLEYVWEEKGLKVTQVQFAPDDMEGMIIQYQIQNYNTEKLKTTFQFNGHVDLRPTWLGERTNMIDGLDTIAFNEAESAWVAKDSNNPWYVKFGSDVKPSNFEKVSTRYQGKGISGSLSYNIVVPANGQLLKNFYIAGSYTSEKALQSTYKSLKTDALKLLKEKNERYVEIQRPTELHTPDSTLNKTFRWLKYTADWFVRTVPEIGSGMAAGYPNFPWWFGCDSEYALQGYLTIGRNDVALNTIELLQKISEKNHPHGRIVHEISTNGEIYDTGNMTETPQFVTLLWKVYLWNGDKQFLKKYFTQVKKGLNWLLTEQDSNKNLIPEGYGMMEIHGLNSEMIDVAAYTQKALVSASKIAYVLGEEGLAKTYTAQAEELKGTINREFWSENFHSFADFIGTDQQALSLIETAIGRAKKLEKTWAVNELLETKEFIKKNPSSKPRPFVLHHNWVVNTPMEVGIADTEKADIALQTARQFTNPFGTYVTGIDRNAPKESQSGTVKRHANFYVSAVMTLPTGVSAIAENNYGNPDHALDYLIKMCNSFSYASPGTMYEVSPDHGEFVQAWNIYGFGVAIIEQFFGVQPNAAKKEVHIKPQMPTKWNDVSLKNLAIADNELSIIYIKENDTISLEIQQQKDWKITVEPPRGYEIASTNEVEPRKTSWNFTLKK
ncbi:glycogen debranching protein [Aureibaculum sp. 2210JD6-5]|uniref:alpha-L-rhamnosidase-related protein n=1 Tax=Aureibaculum sp. 2210JD6-5 TaxID=3103957 RepID=UPI002AACC777|nr:glycogen debranching protein [Aureibaculum sp. 2210JD6-5]MDY7394511.1 glycogen debranching protein [Aureibaculum sp. 2210JD6-5]